MEGRFERPRRDLLRARPADVSSRSCRARVGLSPPLYFCDDDARQLIEELPHVRRQRRRELVEGAFHFVAERRARERLEQCATEIERAQLGERQTGREALERLAVNLPPRSPIVSGSIVEERETRLLERL